MIDDLQIMHYKKAMGSAIGDVGQSGKPWL